MSQCSQFMRHIVTVALLVMVSEAEFGQTGLPAKWSATVSVNVSTSVTQFRSDVTSYVSRELRSLGDVSVTDSEPIYVIEIVAVQMTNNEQQPIGAAKERE